MKRLAQLHALDMRVRQIFCTHLAGGVGRVQEVADRVNERTRALFENAPRLTARDLLGVTAAAEGRPEAFTFSRGDLFAGNPEFWVQVDLPGDGEPQFRFSYPMDGSIRPRRPQ